MTKKRSSTKTKAEVHQIRKANKPEPKKEFRSLLGEGNTFSPAKEIFNGYEIEKRFLVLTVTEDYTKKKNAITLYDEILKDGKRYQQGYVIEMDIAVQMIQELGIVPDFKPNTIRLRKIDDTTFILTLKDRKETKKREVEWELEGKVFNKLWKLTKGHRVYKRRLEKTIKGFRVEFDAFTDRFLIIAEIEVMKESELDNLPNLGLDITGDKSWSNKAMSK